MSHFSVLVVTADDTPEVLQEALQPFHEYECTGVDDQYVIDVDKTAEVEEWLAANIWCGKKKDGGAWDYEHEQARAEELLESPEHMTRRAYFELAGFSQDEQIIGWFGYTKRGNQWVDHTNPNKQWDWWVIGGRYSNRLRVKGNGLPCDQAAVGDLDLAAMLDDRRRGVEANYRGTFADVRKRLQKHPEPALAHLFEADGFEQWEALGVRAAAAEKSLRAVWEAQGKGAMFSTFIDAQKEQGNEDAIALRLAGSVSFGSFFGIELGQTMQQAIDAAVPLSCFAVLKDGQWHEKGSMGWWGMVADEKDDDAWQAQVSALLKDLPASSVITIVDCHI